MSSGRRHGQFGLVLVLQLVLICCAPGCCKNKLIWWGPSYAVPLRVADNYCDCVNPIERDYAQALRAERQGCDACVDQFYEVAIATARHACCDDRSDRAKHLHESSLQKIVEAGQRFGRFDPGCGLTVNRGGRCYVVPIVHRGFVWPRREFSALTPVGEYFTDELSTFYQRPGVGIPMIVNSNREEEGDYRPQNSVFSATFRLDVTGSDLPRFELFDPLRVEDAPIGHERCPIAKDLSAIYAYRLQIRPRNYFSVFIRPATFSPDSGKTEGKLYTLEPYQRGKTPIIFVHGLLSDPFAWAEMVNELLAQPGFVDRFQIWVFEYPTGRPFLASALDLRKQIESAARAFENGTSDPEMNNMLLVGHSMGGLITKLQVTESGDELWQSVSSCPLDQIVTSNETRKNLRDLFYFRPSTRVSRVVYFATPHRGSAIATRCIGRLGSKLVREPEALEEQHTQLMRDNPGVFSREVSRRIPTSIDLLEPNSPLLNAMDQLPVPCNIELHSIIGDLCWTFTLGRSDGVVPIENAKERRAITERIVKANHSGTKEHPESIEEFQAILSLHLRQSGIEWTAKHAGLSEPGDPVVSIPAQVR